MQDRVQIWSDGSCYKNPGGIGSWAFLIVHPDGRRESMAKAYRSTTNNRMELMGAIEGLKFVSVETPVSLISDSKYVIEGLRRWLKMWRDSGKLEGAVKNKDLWLEAESILISRDVRFFHVRGHSEIEENEWCDRECHRAIQAARKDSFLVDVGFEESVDMDSP